MAGPSLPLITTWISFIFRGLIWAGTGLFTFRLLMFVRSFQKPAYSTWYSQAVSHPNTDQEPTLLSFRDRMCAFYLSQIFSGQSEPACLKKKVNSLILIFIHMHENGCNGFRKIWERGKYFQYHVDQWDDPLVMKGWPIPLLKLNNLSLNN